MEYLKKKYLSKPDEEKWKSIEIWAVDGKHRRNQKFLNSGSMNLNYKNYFSIVLLAVINSDYKFVYVDIGAYGKDYGFAVFR